MHIGLRLILRDARKRAPQDENPSVSHFYCLSNGVVPDLRWVLPYLSGTTVRKRVAFPYSSTSSAPFGRPIEDCNSALSQSPKACLALVRGAFRPLMSQ